MRLIDADKLDWWYKGRPIRRVIDEAPTVDAVEVVHGRWEQHGYKWKCSRCGVLMDIDGTPEENLLYYCPNCGAKMDGERRTDNV